MARITHWGPWAFSDSASYLSAARNFNQGLGFVILNSNGGLTHVTEFPPFYPIFLSIFVHQGGDLNSILRWVNIGLLITFLVLFGTLLFKATRSNLLAWLGMLMCITSPVLLEVFSGVMSETLFLPLLCLLFLLTVLYSEHENTGIVHPAVCFFQPAADHALRRHPLRERDCPGFAVLFPARCEIALALTG